MAVTKSTDGKLYPGKPAGRPKVTAKKAKVATSQPRPKSTAPSVSVAAAAGATQRKAEAKQKVRAAARRAVRKDLPAGERKGGLGITKDEGSKGLQKAVKTLGFKGAKKVVKKVAKKRS